MISSTQVKKIAANYGINPGIIERDYILGKVLIGLSKQPQVQETFVFKGGTALKKLFFSHWRYSEDLDFTLIKPLNPMAIKRVFDDSCRICHKDVGLEIKAHRITLPSAGNPKYPGYVGLKLSYTGPLAKASGIKNVIKIDITQDETIIGDIRDVKIIQFYPDDEEATIKSYSLEEITAEKLRSILERGKSRDYYDVWQLLKAEGSRMVFREVVRILKEKCAHEKVKFDSPDDFLSETRIEQARGFWKRGLAHQMKDLPDFDVTMKELRRLLDGISF